MANYRNDFADVNLETGTICRNFMNHSIGSGDALGDRFGVRVFRNGEPVSLGGTVAGYFVRNTTGETVVISSGVVSGNEAYVTLPAACYAVEGSFTLAIKVTSGSETVTMRIIDGVVSRTNTSVTVDPGTLVPSIETLISAINSAVGQIPVNYNASFAPAYSASSTYAVGDYVVYDGYLWRCTTAITETESWTAAHWTKVALANDVSDLKSALDLFQPNLFPEYYPTSDKLVSNNQYIKVSDGTPKASTGWSYFDFVKVIPGSKIRLINYSPSTTSNAGLAFYETKSAYTFISGEGVPYDNLGGLTVTVPDNAHYVRMSVHNSCISNFAFSMEIEPWIEEIESTATMAKSKTEIIGETINLFNKATITPNRYLNNGTPSTLQGYCISDFIPVVSGKTYQIAAAFNSFAYDSNKANPVSISNNASGTVYTAGVSDAYIRLSIANDNVNKAQVIEGWYIPKLTEYGYKIKKETLDFDEATSAPTNFFNPSYSRAGYINTSGTVVTPSSDYRYTQFFKVTPGETYTVYGAFTVWLYEGDETPSRGITGIGHNFKVYTFTPSNDETLMRFSYHNNNENAITFEKNIGYSAYTKSVSGVIPADNIDADGFKTTHILVGTDCYFQTINSANNAITGNSKRNRFVIHIMKGTYNETFRTKDYVDYIGDNKHQCIINYISDDETDYANRSTIFAETNSRIANLTIRTTGSKYPIHADANYGKPYVVTIEDCIIAHDGFTTTVSTGSSGIGIGLHFEQYIVARRCIISGTPYATSGSMSACIYCHNDDQNNTNPNSLRHRGLTIEECILKDTYYGLRWQALETVDGQDNDVTYIGNTNTCEVPFYYNPGTYDSWHFYGLLNTPEYTPSP